MKQYAFDLLFHSYMQQIREHELTFIVPNAQVVVVPYPPSNPLK